MCVVSLFKAVNGLVDVSHDVLPEVMSQTRTSSGNQISFRPAKCKTITNQRSFFIRAISGTWNSLPTTLRSSDTLILGNSKLIYKVIT
jgi:hypothetical protein